MKNTIKREQRPNWFEALPSVSISRTTKRILIILSCFTGLSLILGGCSDYLDSDYLFDERMSMEDVFTNEDYTNQWLARGYSYMGNAYLQDVCSKKDYPFNFADDMYFDGESNRYANWKAGQYSESGLNGESQGIWQNAYKGIRQVSIFLNYIDMNKEFSEQEIADMKGQAHFLRAYYYWIMLRTYGPVPIVPDEGIDYTKEYDEVAQPRNTYDECVDYITKELVTAAETLPLQRSVEALARPSRGAALALRAKVLLFGASPLFNGKAPVEVAAALVDKQGRRLLPETYDESKWAKAAAAAKDVMDLNFYSLHVSYRKDTETIGYPATVTPPYDANFSDKDWPDGWKNIDPFESYRSLFNGEVTASENQELIFTRGQNSPNENIAAMVLHQLPRTWGKGYNSHAMTQKQVDAYYMADGTDAPGMNSMYANLSGYAGRYDSRPRAAGYVTAAELAEYPELGVQGTGVSKQYAEREPRFYASVAYNGSTWYFLNAQESAEEQKNKQIFYYRGEDNGYKISYSLLTGIGIKKYVHPDDISLIGGSYNRDRIREKVDPALRYGEILLIYAEALNELAGNYSIPSWDGSKVHTVGRDVSEMKKGIQPIRIRAGISDYTDDVYADADRFRVKLKRERQIELFAEGCRYFDIRRWMDVPVEEAASVYGCNIYCGKEMADLYHTPVEVPSLAPVFSLKLWLWPIHYTELKRNKELTQNPGWTYPE
ncbi:MAG: RagB/SusD family nutrient uptake outer membrane protein [Prolixibacteraceae bacterium]